MNFDPIFVFDSREQWFPVGVEESLKHFGYEWHRSSWYRTLASPQPRESKIDFPADMKPPILDIGPVGYHRSVVAAPLVWHQWWLWYLYNPWSVAGVGRHEGDWEFIQIGATASVIARPVLVTASQHHSGGKREFWACELRDDRPVIYVARGSHANYFNAGRLGGGIDECDGKGRVLDTIEWRDFGPWKDWPGRWGNSTGEGKSPASPGRQGKRWHAPHLFHSEAK